MYWNAEYSSTIVKGNTGHGKDKILERVLNTLQRFPYVTAHLYKFSGDKKIYVESYDYDVDAWNNKGISRLKKVTR